jgi:ABC-type transport system involved in cytochrome c biogenesis permease subunit
MLYIHPALAIVGYVFIFLFAVAFSIARFRTKRFTGVFGLAAWLFTFLGLATGMFWAQTAWGSYWSWDPKETATLLLFVSVTLCSVFNLEAKQNLTKWAAYASCALVIITILISYVSIGLHSF